MTPYENGLTFSGSDMVMGKGETVSKIRARAMQAEKEWGNKMIGQKANGNWTTRLGEDLVRDTLEVMGVNPRKPKTIGGYSPDWETDDAIWEVKTRSWTVSGTAGEKVLGTFYKYSDIPELYGKPLKIVCLAYQEWELSHGTTRLFGKVSPQKQAILDVAKKLNIEYVKFSTIAMKVFGDCFVLDDSALKVPDDEVVPEEVKEREKEGEMKAKVKNEEQILYEQYHLHKDYVKKRIEARDAGIDIRLPNFPEDISENMIRILIQRILGDETCTRKCKGDLLSKLENKQECKTFTSTGPISFTPSSSWDVIYFLDARGWLDDNFTLYRLPCKYSSEIWQNIKVNKTETFRKQASAGRRPRISWDGLYPQIQEHVEKIWSGKAQDIFLPH